VKAWTTLARDPGFGGGELVLQERDGVFVIRSGGRELMSSARQHSEEAMTEVLTTLRTPAPTVLVGGLGLGYTLRAALDRVPAAGTVVVSEISAAVVEWNRQWLAPLAGAPLEDPRTRVALADVADVLSTERFDAVLLDVDNGPSALSTPKNQQLYGPGGVAMMRKALKPNGVVVVWSAGPDEGFLKALGRGGFEATAERSVARKGSSASHVLFTARLPNGRRASSR
jgi:spermidine synthase